MKHILFDILIYMYCIGVGYAFYIVLDVYIDFVGRVEKAIQNEEIPPTTQAKTILILKAVSHAILIDIVVDKMMEELND